MEWQNEKTGSEVITQGLARRGGWTHYRDRRKCGTVVVVIAVGDGDPAWQWSRHWVAAAEDGSSPEGEDRTDTLAAR